MTTWCPHCKTAMPAWNNFKEQIGTSKINGIKINFNEIDCEKDTALAEQYNVRSVPTLVIDGNSLVGYRDKNQIKEAVGG